MKTASLILAFALGICGPASAQTAELQFSVGDGYAIVRDVAFDQSQTDCTAPFTPITVTVQKDPRSGFLASHNFLDQSSPEGTVIQRYGATRNTFNNALLRIRPRIADADADDLSSDPDAVSEEDITLDITLTGCGFGQHLDIRDGSISIMTQLARYSIEIDETFSDLWEDTHAASRAHYAPTLWSTNAGQQGPYATERWRAPRAALGDHIVLGMLFLDVWMTRPVYRAFPEATLITRFQIGARVPVIDQRDPSLAAHPSQASAPQSRFVSVTPLSDR